MAEEYYTLPEAPVYNAEEIRKIQDSDPVRASTIVNPVVERLIENTHAVKLQADDNTAAIGRALGVAEDADDKAERALRAAQQAAQDAAGARLSADQAMVAADAALEAITKLANTIDAIPSQNGSLTYTGSAQTPSWNSFNPDALEIGGDTSGINAGTYTATFTPKENYTWGDGTNDARSVTWTIGRAAIAAAPVQSGSLTYTGQAQTPSWSNYNTAQLTISGTTSATEAGSHSAMFTPTANYQWSDGSTAARSISWTIGRAVITGTPAQSGSLTYTGSTQTPSWSNYDSAQLTIGGTASATNAGTYSASFTPTANYQWSDGKTAAKSVNWTIGKAAGSLSLNKTSMTLNGSTKSSTIAVTRAGDGAVSATSSNTSVATVSVSGTTVTVTGKAYGTVTITVRVAAGTNHTAPADKTCSVTVNVFNTNISSNSWAAIKAASDAGEGANFWSVGDTKPIVINGKVGNFTFSNLTINPFILGFNHNSAKEGTKRIHWLIGKISGKMVGLCDDRYNSNSTNSGYFQMNTSNTNAGGWKDSYMRKTLLGNSNTPTSPLANSLMAALPSDLRAVMKAVTKYTDNVGNATGHTAGNVTSTSDYLFLLSNYEVQGNDGYANSYEKNSQAQYDYFKAGNSKVAYKHSTTGTAVWWWLRSPCYNGTDTFCNVYTDGSYTVTTLTTRLGCCPALLSNPPQSIQPLSHPRKRVAHRGHAHRPDRAGTWRARKRPTRFLFLTLCIAPRLWYTQARDYDERGEKMSVLLNRRVTSKADFVNVASEIYDDTIAFLTRLSARYSRLMAEPIAMLAGEVEDFAEKANSIFPSDPQRIDLRIRHLLEARASLMALDVRLNKCYRIMSKNPEGCFTTSTGRTVDAREAAEKLEAMADNLGAKIDRENDLLKGQIESTSKRRKK